MPEDGEQEKEVARQRVESAVAELRAALSAMRGCKRGYTVFELKMTEQLLTQLDGPRASKTRCITGYASWRTRSTNATTGCATRRAPRSTH